VQITDILTRARVCVGQEQEAAERRALVFVFWGFKWTSSFREHVTVTSAHLGNDITWVQLRMCVYGGALQNNFTEMFA